MAKWLFGVIASLSLGIAGTANAGSPQVLALLETIAPVPMVCEGDSCRAELSAFCLQEAASAPGHGTAYSFAGDGSFELVLSDAAGKQHRIAAAGELRIASVRGYAAVAVSLPRGRLEALGARSAEIEVGPGVSLLPASLAAAPERRNEPDVQLATGPWRAVGKRVVEDEGGATLTQVRALNAMINLLPLHDREAPGFRERVWQAALSGGLADAAPAGLAGARQRLEACSRRGRYLDVSFMTLCLQFRHDALVESLTQDYWRVVGAGS